MRRLQVCHKTRHYSTGFHRETHLQRGQVSVVRNEDLQWHGLATECKHLAMRALRRMVRHCITCKTTAAAFVDLWPSAMTG
jgi:hypothetical protein